MPEPRKNYMWALLGVPNTLRSRRLYDEHVRRALEDKARSKNTVRCLPMPNGWKHRSTRAVLDVMLGGANENGAGDFGQEASGQFPRCFNDHTLTRTACKCPNDWGRACPTVRQGNH